MKIAISLPDNIFRKVQKAAEDQKRSRSEIFVEAVKAYLDRLESRRLLRELNEVYSATETDEERASREASLKIFAESLLKGEE